MSDYSWVCPSCNRRVPAQISKCRCGCEWDPALVDSVRAVEQAVEKSKAVGSRAFKIVLGAVAVVGVAAIAGTRMSQPSSAPTAETVVRAEDPTSTTPVSPDPSPDSAAQPPVATGAPSVKWPIALSTEAPPASAPSAPPGNFSSSLEDVISDAMPAVVSIETREGRGSGFFVSPGVVLTNNHVVSGNVSVTVRLPSGASLPGRVDRTSAEIDLAMVHVDGMPASQALLPLGSAADVRVGQEVIAIGLAMGQFQGTVTRGIISALRRAGSGSGVLLLQTDAAINPGNSGGPLIDRSGKVVGITTLKVAGSAESLGFAVAADHARSFLAGGNAQAPSIAASAPHSAPLAPAFSSKSESDLRREQGLQAFDQSLRSAATRAVQIDDYWKQIKRECGVRASGVYDREWFALWENRLTIGNSDGGCLSAMNTLRDAADQLRSAMRTLHEDARRAGVYPGDLRQTRTKHHLDWTGWDR